MNTCRKETLLLCTPPKSSSSKPFTTFHTHTLAQPQGPWQSGRARAQKQAWDSGKTVSPTRKAGVRPRETDWEAGHKVFTTCPKGQAGV